MGIVQEVHELRMAADSAVRLAERHEEQISGRQGLLEAFKTLTEEVRGLKRALYVAGGSFVLAAIGFGFFALQTVGTG